MDENNPQTLKILEELEDLKAALDNASSQMGKINANVDKIRSSTRETNASIFRATMIMVVLLALISNPKRNLHLEHLAGHLPGKSADALRWKQLLGPAVNFIAPSLTEYESYGFFSITKCRIDDTEIPLTLGIFGNVFDLDLPKDLRQKLDKFRD